MPRTTRRRELLQSIGSLLVLPWAGLSAAACRSREGAPLSSASAAPDASAPALRTFTPEAFATLSAVCERLLPRDEDPGAIDLGVPAYIDEALTARELATSRELLLHVLPILDKESRKRFGGKVFHEAAPTEQDTILSAWQHGRDGSQHFFDVIMSLTMEGAFGDPKHGGNVGGRGFTMIGFAPGPPLTKVTPMGDMHHGRGALVPNDPVDAVVVGSGAGGAPVAYELAAAGLKVVILEKGRRYRDEEFDHDEIRMCRRSFFTPPLADDPHTLRTSDSATAARSTAGWISVLVGGGTVHMAGYFFRFHPIDFKLRSALGSVPGSTLVDWPLRYEDLEPYYGRVEREVGVSGVWRSHPFEEPRTADFPLPPLAENGFAAQIDAACAKLGYHPFPTPRAILSRDHGGRMACMFCALCANYGCEIGAKSSTLASLIPLAEKTGFCVVREQCTATEIPIDAGGKVTGVVYRDASGESAFQPARCVVVACSAIETARLLLSSQSSRFPKGLANGSGQVGKNLVFSGSSKGEALFKQAGREAAPWLVDPAPFVQRSMQDFYFLDHPVDGMRKAGTILFSLAHPNPIVTAERIAGTGDQARWGLRLKKALREEAAHARTLTFENFAESLPTPGTYVDLDPDVKDRWGMPVARITSQPHALDAPASRLLAARAKDVLDALGPDSSRITQGEGPDMVLQGGTCRFGRDPATSVLDVDCRAHTVPNLYVSDSSFFPTSGGVPPTMTILANAMRVGERLVARFKAGGI